MAIFRHVIWMAVALGACASPGPGPERSLAAWLPDRLDSRDAAAAHRAETRALDSNRPSAWRGAGTGYRGLARPLRSLQVQGRQCREIVHTIIDGDMARDVRGILCRMPEGMWRVVE